MASVPQRSGRLAQRVAAVGLITMSLAALLMAGGALLELAKLARLESWPTVPGTVSLSQVQPGCKVPAGFTPRIQYTYMYEGILYPGSLRSFNMAACDTREAVSGIVSRYPAGAAVTVHVNPSRPSEAVLETAVDTGALWGLAIAALLVGAAGMAWVVPRLRAVFSKS
jgi:hypothetical protein